MDDFKPHILVLGVIKESQMGLGRQLLASCLRGEKDEKTLKLRLNRLVHFGSLPLYDTKDILELTDMLQQRGYIECSPLPQNKFIKVLALTKKGEEELKHPKEAIIPRKSYEGHFSRIGKVTEDDRKIFSSLGDLLEGLSDEQKKAVICNSRNILCIAGAGSGKTKALTKRAWYLTALKSVEPSKILAITFTRKARQEMIDRLGVLLPNNAIEIETFNSFCEKILRRNENEIYGKKYTVMDYSTKVKLVMKVLHELDIEIDVLLENYYSDRKLFSEDKKVLFLGFVNDIFSLLDYQRNNNIPADELTKLLIDYPNIRNIVDKINYYKQEECLRDFTDQIVHVLEFFRAEKASIPAYEHILVDEYQDINNLQFELLALLNPGNLFAVGDPRQAIYGWRGSRIDYILDFEKNYENSEVLQLNTNYRSTKKIVELCNKVISTMKLPALTSFGDDGEPAKFVKHTDIEAESLFVCQSILSLNCSRNNIFVLARTNKQLDAISPVLDRHGIKYIKRTIEDTKQSKTPQEDEITLSTIHAIKGLEADVVYLIGANSKNHPCKASEHPVLESVKVNDTYDKYAEELRLLYVALSRARKKLIINYTGSLSQYFDEGNKKIQITQTAERLYKSSHSSLLYDELKAFRLDESQSHGIAAYQVFNDRTLDELCDMKPTCIEDLSEISGFGPFKVRKWGNKIIKIITENS